MIRRYSIPVMCLAALRRSGSKADADALAPAAAVLGADRPASRPAGRPAGEIYMY